jgi:phytoene synthase
MAAALSPLAAEVRRYDRDRFVTALFAPADKRESLYALYAFNAEVARIRELVTEPLLGEMRLQWWRDALATIYAGNDLAHPVAIGLAAAIRAHGLSRDRFERIVDARAADLVNGPPDSLATLIAYAHGTAAPLAALALEILGASGETAERAARPAGTGWALVGLLRAVPFHASAGRLFLPSDLLAEHGVAAEHVLAGKASANLARVAETLAGWAHRHLAHARAERFGLPRSARSALLTTTLAEIYLRRLARVRFDLMDTRWSVVRPMVVRLALRSLTTGY